MNYKILPGFAPFSATLSLQEKMSENKSRTPVARSEYLALHFRRSSGQIATVPLNWTSPEKQNSETFFAQHCVLLLDTGDPNPSELCLYWHLHVTASLSQELAVNFGGKRAGS
jgi:hypothetical protein